MTASLIITTFNRPNYLERCFNSLSQSDLSQISEIIIVDDCSSDIETKNLIKEFYLDNCNIIKRFKSKNKGIKDSLIFGYNVAFGASEIVINLDGDAIVSKTWVSTLLELKKQFPDNIVCGFNTTVKNRNPIIEEHSTYFKKKYASGINMVINKDQYEKYVLPGLVTKHNWDFEASKLHEADGKAVIVSKPSVVQHIGIEESSMGHISTSEPPDYADDFEEHKSGFTIKKKSDGITIMADSDCVWDDTLGKLSLPEVTLICADGVDINRVIHAANISCKKIEFGAVKILSNFPSDDPRTVRIRPLVDRKDYSQFVLKEMVNYVDTEYMMIFQYDGFPIKPMAWSEEFLKWDMVGASWKFRPEKRTANGGFSLRSKIMMELIRDDEAIYLQNDHIIKNYAEDHVLFYIYREYLEQKYDVKIAPEEICDKFSIEGWGVKENKYNGSFGFHGFSVDFNDADLPYVPYKLPNRQIL